MSHFTVLVIGPDPEAQLAPYQENNMGDCPKEYLAFNDTEEEMLKQYQTETSKRVVMPDGRLLCTFDDCFKVPDTRPGSFSFSTTFEIPPELEQREVPFTELYPTFEDFATDWHGSRERDPEMNRYGYWENPNAKWDWFQMGGRWTGFYKLKEVVAQIGGVLGTPGLMTPEAEAGHADQLMAGDVDFEGMRIDAAVKAFQQYEDVAQAFGGEIPKIERLWKEVVADESLGGIDARRDFYHAQPALVRLKELQASDGLPKSMDRYFFDLEDFQCNEETYVERAKNSACVPFAFVKESQWYERGRMGWWACVSNEKDRDEWNHQFNKMMDELPANTLLTLVDCHI